MNPVYVQCSHLEPWSSYTFFSDEAHYEYMLPQQNWLWARNAGLIEPVQIPELFFSPHLHHFSGIAAAVTSSESEVPTHISAQIETVKSCCQHIVVLNVEGLPGIGCLDLSKV